VFLGNIGHYGCHGVRVLASVGGQLQRKNPPGTYCIEEFAKDNRLIDMMYSFITKPCEQSFLRACMVCALHIY